MKFKYLLTFTSLLIFSFGWTTLAKAQDIEAFGRACLSVLVPNELRVEHSNNSEAAFRDALCGDWFTSHRAQVEGQGEINLLEIVSAGGGGSSDTRTVTRTQFCQERNLTSTTRTKMSFWSRIVPNEAREEFNRCMDLFRAELEPRTPVKIAASQVGDAGVAVTLRWDRNVTLVQPIFDRFDTTNIDCPRNAIPAGRRIPVEGITARCSWGRNFPTHGIIIAQTRGGGSSLTTVRRDTPLLGTAALQVTRTVDRVIAQEQVCGPVVFTHELHEVECGEGCDCRGDRWCHRNVDFPTIDARADVEGFHRTIHSPRLLCPNDNQGSCAWNEVDRPSRLDVFVNTPTHIQARRIFGSRRIGVSLCVTEDRIGPTDESSIVKTEDIFEGKTFRAEIPIERATAVWLLRLGAGGEDFLRVGDSQGRLQLVNRAEVGDMIFFTYRVVPLVR